MINSHKEMTHILGLGSNPFLSHEKNTGWEIKSAVVSINKRYNALKSNMHSQLNFELLFSYTADQFSEKTSHLSHGEYLGISSRWVRKVSFLTQAGHAYTLHAIKDGNRTHFIYVNRGERHVTSDATCYKNTSIAFSIDNANAENFAKELITAAKGGRKSISLFIQKNEKKINHPLANLLRKKNQLIGNCCTANSNIAWHFQLAADYMKDHKTCFEVAYNQTKHQYKEMRIRDRVEAFKYLLQDRKYYLSNKAYFYNYIQALNKFTLKDSRDKTNHIELLVGSLNSKDLSELITPLLSKNFEKNLKACLEVHLKQVKIPNKLIGVSKMLNATREEVLSKAFNKLPEKKQKQFIKEDPSLFRYASDSVKETLKLSSKNNSETASYFSKFKDRYTHMENSSTSKEPKSKPVAGLKSG